MIRLKIRDKNLGQVPNNIKEALQLMGINRSNVKKSLGLNSVIELDFNEKGYSFSVIVEKETGIVRRENKSIIIFHDDTYRREYNNEKLKEKLNNMDIHLLTINGYVYMVDRFTNRVFNTPNYTNKNDLLSYYSTCYSNPQRTIKPLSAKISKDLLQMAENGY